MTSSKPSMTVPAWCAALVAILAAGPAPAQEDDAVGTVADLVGTVLVTHAAAAEPERLAIEAPVFEGDHVRTREESRAKLVFIDESVMTLGANSELTVEWYLYGERTGLRAAILDVPLGIFRVVAEALLPRSTFEVRTATAVASIRGTDWMAEVTEDATAVVALSGAVAVANIAPGVPGEVVLEEGEGTTVRAGEPPTPPSEWGAERVERFLRATAVP